MNRRILCIAVLFIAVVSLGAASYSVSSPSADELAIQRLFADFSAGIKARDLNKVMSVYSRDEHAIYYDAFTPRQYVGYTAYRKDYAGFFKQFPGPVSSKITDLHIGVSGSIAYAYGIDSWNVSGADRKPQPMVFRFSELLRKENGKWVVFHEHVSFPVDPATNKVDYMSKP